jgi:hypothetical protein
VGDLNQANMETVNEKAATINAWKKIGRQVNGSGERRASGLEEADNN